MYDLMRKSKSTMAAPFVSSCVCASCGAPGDSIFGGVKLKPCSVCKTAKYCGRECQVEHWKKHKPDCRAPTAVPPGDKDKQPKDKGKPPEHSVQPSPPPSDEVQSFRAVNEATIPAPPDPKTATEAKKKKPVSSDYRECANCLSSRLLDGSNDPLKSCARCGLVYYCGRPCQAEHWKFGKHKQFCVTREERSVAAQQGLDATAPRGDARVRAQYAWVLWRRSPR